MSLQRTRDALRSEVAKERARSSAAQARLDTFRASRWGLAAEVARDMARKPWRAPKLAMKVFKAARSKGARDSNVVAGEALFAQKRYDEAVVAYDRALARDPANVRALQRKRDALSKMGSLSGMLAVVRQMQAVGDLEALRRFERALIGRLRELDPSWLPELPGAPTALEPSHQGKVLHFLKFSLPYHTNGYTVRSHYTLRAQREAGLEPVVATTIGFPRTDGVSTFEAVEHPDGIPHHRLDLGPDFPYKALPLDEQTTLNAWLLAQIVEQERPAIIHARSGFRGYETVLASLAAGKKYDIPVVYEISSFLESTWTADVQWAERGELYDLRFAQEVRCMREAAHVVTIADSMRDEIIARGIDASKVTVIPNAVDADEFAPRAADTALLDRLGLTGKVVLGYISNLGAREGIEVLIEATSILAKQGDNVACLLVGEGPERARLEKLAVDLGAPVHFTGAVPHEQIKDYYAAIDIFVVPRIDDRAARWVTPLKPYEAAAMGKPLIVSALPALLEIAAPDRRGLSFEPGNARALAEQAKRLVDDPALRRQIGDAARAWVVAERTWTANGERYRALYERILAARPQIARPPVAPPEDEQTLRAEIASLEEQLATMRGARKYAERAFRSSKVLRARGVVRAARAERGGMLKLVRNFKTLVRKARGGRGPSSLTPGTTPRGAVHAATAAAKLPDANPRDGSLLERGMEAIRLLDTDKPVVLAYYPLVRNNPYQAMLYSAGWEYGIAAVPLLDLDALDDVPALHALGAQVWFHIHWTAPILARAEDRAHALAKVQTFIHRLDALKKAGGKIAWSIHNVLPHEHTFRDLEVVICEALAARADMVHVLSEATMEQTKPHYTIRPETVRHVPLPGYLDVYPNLVSKAQARYELGIPAHATTFAMVGGIRKYKGVAGLIDAFENVAAERDDYRLIIAGPPIDFDDSTGLQARCDAHPQIIGRFERVPENDLQIYLNAADVVVLPYEDILNSSVLMLAFAFGRPVVASRKGALAELVTDDVGMLFEHGKLEETLRAAEKLKEPRYAEAALERARAYPPKKMSEDFARYVLEF